MKSYLLFYRYLCIPFSTNILYLQREPHGWVKKGAHLSDCLPTGRSFFCFILYADNAVRTHCSFVTLCGLKDCMQPAKVAVVYCCRSRRNPSAAGPGLALVLRPSL